MTNLDILADIELKKKGLERELATAIESVLCKWDKEVGLRIESIHINNSTVQAFGIPSRNIVADASVTLGYEGY